MRLEAVSPIRYLVVLVAAGVVSVASACGNPTEPRHAIDVRLAAREYTLTGPSVQVSYSVQNLSNVTVDLTSRCGDRLVPAVERRQADRWEQSSGGICLAVFDASPVPLPAGERRDEVTFASDVGEYRLVIATDRGPAVSETFVVR
jgi:hypothetical protein